MKTTDFPGNESVMFSDIYGVSGITLDCLAEEKSSVVSVILRI